MEVGLPQASHSQKSNFNAVGIVQRSKTGMGIGTLLQENAKDGEKRNKLSHKQKSDPKQVKVFINSVLLTIKMSASMLSVQKIHNHMAKYVSILESW